MARFSNGWIKIYREAIDGDIGEDPFVLGTFVKLLIWANWRESNTRLAGQRVKIQPGQVVTGLRELSPDVEIDPYLHRIRTALKYLVKRGTITQTTSNHGRVITICNWSEYQATSDDSSKQHASDAQAESKQAASSAQHSEEDKKGRSKKEEAVTFDFESLYRKYPRKEGKDPGLKQCKKQILAQDTFDALSRAIDRYAEHCESTGQIIKMFSSFLGSDRTGHPWREWLDQEAGQGAINPGRNGKPAINTTPTNLEAL